MITKFAIVEERRCELILTQTIAAWMTPLTARLRSVLETDMVMPTVHGEECGTKPILAIITATMTTVPQQRLAETHTSAVVMPVFLSTRCAEATPCARTDPMSEPVMRLSLVSGI